MQNNKIALVAGATGLIGKLLLKKLASDSYYQEIITVTRRELTGDQPEKVTLIIPDHFPSQKSMMYFVVWEQP